MVKKVNNPGKSYSVNIGDQASFVAVGENIKQINTRQFENHIVTNEDIALVQELFSQLRDRIQKEISSQKAPAALERVHEIEEEVISNKPKVSTFKYVRNWFGKNAPSLLGTLTSVFIHPVIGKIVEAAGEIAADEFKKLIQSP